MILSYDIVASRLQHPSASKVQKAELRGQCTLQETQDSVVAGGLRNDRQTSQTGRNRYHPPVAVATSSDSLHCLRQSQYPAWPGRPI